MVAFTFISCDEPEAPHKHEFVSKFDSENHWLECSCKEKKDVVKHDLYTAEIKEDKVIIKCRDCEYSTEDAIAKYVVINTEDELRTAFATTTDKTVILNANIALSKSLLLTGKITLDLNGHEISATPEFIKAAAVGSSLLYVYADDSKLIIDDSSLNKAGAVDSVKGNVEENLGFAIVLWPNDNKTASLIINAGTFRAPDCAISGNGTHIWENATYVEINGGKIESTGGSAIYNPQNGSVVINGGEFIGPETALEIRAGNLKITDGLFKSTAEAYACKPNGSGGTVTGAAVAVSQHTTKLPINVEILGGEFVGQKGIVKENPQNNDAEAFAKVTVAVKGGKFNTNPGELVATGFKAVELSGAWVVSKAE